MKSLHLQHPAAAGAYPDHPFAARRRMQAEFFARMGGRQQFQALFDHLPDVHFFAKDAEGRFVAGGAGLLQRLGFSREEELLGLTDADIHPARTAREIREDDLRVMQTGKPLRGRVEALFTRSRATDWYVTTKLPIFSLNREVIGIMGFVRPCQRDKNAPLRADRIQPVIAHIQAEYARPIAAPELARLANLSVRQLHRLFHEFFGMSTQAFIVRTRLQAASDALLLSDKPLSDIAVEHGFCDQSAFCRRFCEHTGETPLKFRQRHRRGMSAEYKKTAQAFKTHPLHSI